MEKQGKKQFIKQNEGTPTFSIAAPFFFLFKLFFLQNINLTFPLSNIHDFTDDLLTRPPKIGEKEAAPASYSQSQLCC